MKLNEQQIENVTISHSKQETNEKKVLDNSNLCGQELLEKLKQQKKFIEFEELTEEQLDSITTNRTR